MKALSKVTLVFISIYFDKYKILWFINFDLLMLYFIPGNLCVGVLSEKMLGLFPSWWLFPQTVWRWTDGRYKLKLCCVVWNKNFKGQSKYFRIFIGENNQNLIETWKKNTGRTVGSFNACEIIRHIHVYTQDVMFNKQMFILMINNLLKCCLEMFDRVEIFKTHVTH